MNIEKIVQEEHDRCNEGEIRTAPPVVKDSGYLTKPLDFKLYRQKKLRQALIKTVMEMNGNQAGRLADKRRLLVNYEQAKLPRMTPSIYQYNIRSAVNVIIADAAFRYWSYIAKVRNKIKTS